MKVIDGKFKKDEEEETTLADKIMIALAQQIDAADVGNFVLLLDVGGEEVFVSTDTSIADAVYLLEIAKLNLLSNPNLSSEVLH